MFQHPERRQSSQSPSRQRRHATSPGRSERTQRSGRGRSVSRPERSNQNPQSSTSVQQEIGSSQIESNAAETKSHSLVNVSTPSPKVPILGRLRGEAGGGKEEDQQISHSDYDQVKELVKDIQTQYPPSKYFYIGMGKSPTPIIAFMQAKGTPAKNIPLSKFSPKPNNIKKGDNRYKHNADPLTPEQREELKHHFDNFVPLPEVLEGKNILLIDYTESGRSLIASHAHIVEYLDEKYKKKKSMKNYVDHGLDKPPKVVPLALYQQEAQGAEERLDDLGLTNRIQLPGSLNDTQSLASHIGGEKYKKRAQYPDDYKIVKSPPDKTQDIKWSPEKYDKLVEQFRSFMT